MTDPIADMLTRIRNAALVKKAEVVLPMSKLKYEIARILKEEGWIMEVEIKKGKSQAQAASERFDRLRIVLKYKKSGRPAFSSLKKVSKPGLRIYAGKDQLPRVLNNLGMAVISTPQGIMTNKQARRQGLGGEVLCEIY